MLIRFEPIADKCGEIVEKLMASPEMPSDEDILFKVRLSVEEVVENIVTYAYNRGDGWLEAETLNDGKAVTVVLRDAGTPFNPLDKEDPDITLPASERTIGGLGIFLCKKMMDKVSYEYKDGCNILTMSKNLSNIMDVVIKTNEGKTEVCVAGRIDTSSTPEFQQAIAPLMEGEKPDIEVDCSGLEYISSSGLRLFLMLKKSVDSRAGKLVLKSMRPQVKDVFDITGFSSIIPIV